MNSQYINYYNDVKNLKKYLDKVIFNYEVPVLH